MYLFLCSNFNFECIFFRNFFRWIIYSCYNSIKWIVPDVLKPAHINKYKHPNPHACFAPIPVGIRWFSNIRHANTSSQMPLCQSPHFLHYPSSPTSIPNHIFYSHHFLSPHDDVASIRCPTHSHIVHCPPPLPHFLVISDSFFSDYLRDPLHDLGRHTHQPSPSRYPLPMTSVLESALLYYSYLCW